MGLAEFLDPAFLRDYIKPIADDSVKGLMRSLGDAGASPTNATGETVLKRLADIETYLKELNDALVSIGTDELRVISV